MLLAAVGAAFGGVLGWMADDGNAPAVVKPPTRKPCQLERLVASLQAQTRRDGAVDVLEQLGLETLKLVSLRDVLRDAEIEAKPRAAPAIAARHKVLIARHVDAVLAFQRRAHAPPDDGAPSLGLREYHEGLETLAAEIVGSAETIVLEVHSAVVAADADQRLLRARASAGAAAECPAPKRAEEGDGGCNLMAASASWDDDRR